MGWLRAIAAAVTRWATAHPVAAIISGIAAIVAGSWIAGQKWKGADVVATLLYGGGGLLIALPIKSAASKALWEAKGRTLWTILQAVTGHWLPYPIR